METEIPERKSTSSNRSGLTAEIYEAVKAEIIAGALKSRDRLYEPVLAKRFKTSRTPVREALQRLISEGLAEARPDGVCVAALSVQDVRSLEQANRALQSLAAELAAREGSAAGAAELEALMARMEACAVARDLDGWMATDQDIHRYLSFPRTHTPKFYEASNMERYARRWRTVGWTSSRESLCHDRRVGGSRCLCARSPVCRASYAPARWHLSRHRMKP